MGDRTEVPAAVGVRGEHEPDPHEHLGRRVLPRAHVAGWGDFYDVARTLVERDASVLVTPASNYLGVASRWVEALLDIYAGRAETVEALESAAAAIDGLVTSSNAPS